MSEENEFLPKKSVVERFGKLIMNNKTLYSEIEHLIIRWNLDGTKTAGSLTRDIMKVKTKINREELYKLYMEWVEQVTEECDWKTSFGPEEIVGAIATILENNPHLYEQSR